LKAAWRLKKFQLEKAAFLRYLYNNIIALFLFFKAGQNDRSGFLKRSLLVSRPRLTLRPWPLSLSAVPVN
jgi:hypothetical protein